MCKTGFKIFPFLGNMIYFCISGVVRVDDISRIHFFRLLTKCRNSEYCDFDENTFK